MKQVKTRPVTTSDSVELRNAKLVFEHTLTSVNKFYELFQKNRKGTMGSTTHVEQDLLRAMLVFSCSGLDAVVKQLIKDGLASVIGKEAGAQQEFQKFIERRIKKSNFEEKEKLLIDVGWIASIFASATPREQLIAALCRNLTDDSLQSRDQLLKVASHFAITQVDLLEKPEETKKAFDVRNEIIHEMDTDLSGKKKRNQRAEKVMVDYCKNVLNAGSNFINLVQQKIYGSTP